MSITAKPNPLKEIFKSRSSVGLWHGINDRYAAEIVAGAGFDWILIDGEHGPFDYQSILAQMQAMSAHSAEIIVRPPSDDPIFLKRLLDAGVQNLLIPMVESADQVERIVSSVHYPPKGKRGIGSALSRAAQWKRVSNYLETADEQLCVIVQIESVAGMKNIESIVEVDHIDGVFIGPADLAGSMGYLGQPMHPDVVQEVKRGLEIIQSAGKTAGTLAVKDELIQEYNAAGATMIGVGVDLVLLAKATEQLAAHVKSVLK